MRGILFVGLIFALLAGCKTPVTPAPPVASDLSPEKAIFAAAGGPITGTFRMEVRASGRQRDRLYLNSEEDYRDQRCLTISIPGNVAQDLKKRLGSDPATALIGKTIRVTGTAERTQITFMVDGKPTDKYYYQTHVRLAAASQLEVVPFAP